jgi:hypothetical protein
MAVKNKDEFQSKYGAPKSPDAQVLIGMRGGKAVYGSELDAADTSGKGVINNTYSQNQAIMDDMFKGMKQSGGVYNPSPTATAKMDQMYPPTAADSKVTTRADGNQMVGANSPEAANMREKTSANNQFAATMARLTAPTNKPDTVATSAPSAMTTPPIAASNPMLGMLGGENPTEIAPAAFDVAGENANFLIGLNKKKSTPKQSNTEVVSVNGRDVPVHKAETMDYRPERDGVMLGVTTTSGQEPTIFGKTLGQMSPEERGLWTKKPEGIDFDEDGMLFGTAQKRSPEEEARIAKWEESELQNNPEVRGRRIKTYEEQLKGATTNDPEELRSKGYNPEGVAAAKKELERLRGMGKNTNATTKPKTQLPNPYQDRVDGLLAFGDSPANWGF